MDSLTLEVLAIVSEILKRKRLPDVSQTETQLVTKGFLDSVDILAIVVTIEQRFGVNFGVQGFDQTDFDSADAIVRLIRHLQRGEN